MTQSIAHQSESELGGAGSILVRQRREHIRLDELLHRVDETTGDERAAALNELARLVFPHAFAEESVLWPLSRRLVTEAPELTLEIEQEHQRINELWSDLEKLPAGPEHDAVWVQLKDLLRQDVRDEEDRLFPLLHRRLDERGLRRVGMQWEAVRRISPTRPHAVVARRPPGNMLAALPLTVLDRARDNADRLARSSGSYRQAARRVSASLARLAGYVEHAPGMKRGENDSTRVDRPV